MEIKKETPKMVHLDSKTYQKLITQTNLISHDDIIINDTFFY